MTKKKTQEKKQNFQYRCEIVNLAIEGKVYQPGMIIPERIGNKYEKSIIPQKYAKKVIVEEKVDIVDKKIDSKEETTTGSPDLESNVVRDKEEDKKPAKSEEKVEVSKNDSEPVTTSKIVRSNK